MHRLQSGPVFSHQTGAVRSQKIGPDRYAPVPIFLRTIHSPVSNIKTGPYDSPDWTGPWDRTSVRSQNSGPDCLQISPVRSGPSLTVRSGQSNSERDRTPLYVDRKTFRGVFGVVVRSTAVGEVGTIRATGYPGTQE